MLAKVKSLRLGTDKPVADGKAHQPRNVFDVKGFTDLGAVGLDGFDAHLEGLGDVFVGVALHHQLQHFALAWGQGL